MFSIILQTAEISTKSRSWSLVPHCSMFKGVELQALWQATLKLRHIFQLMCLIPSLPTLWGATWFVFSSNFCHSLGVSGKSCNRLRYVGVIYFAFMFRSFYQLHLYNKNSCCINKSTIEHLQKSDWKLDMVIQFSYGYRRRCMLVNILSRYNCVHYWM